MIDEKLKVKDLDIELPYRHKVQNTIILARCGELEQTPNVICILHTFLIAISVKMFCTDSVLRSAFRYMKSRYSSRFVDLRGLILGTSTGCPISTRAAHNVSHAFLPPMTAASPSLEDLDRLSNSFPTLSACFSKKRWRTMASVSSKLPPIQSSLSSVVPDVSYSSFQMVLKTHRTTFDLRSIPSESALPEEHVLSKSRWKVPYALPSRIARCWLSSEWS